MASDALFFRVSRPSAVMVLNVQDKLEPVLNQEWVKVPVPFECWKKYTIQDMYIFPEINSAPKGFKKYL